MSFDVDKYAYQVSEYVCPKTKQVFSVGDKVNHETFGENLTIVRIDFEYGSIPFLCRDVDGSEYWCVRGSLTLSSNVKQEPDDMKEKLKPGDLVLCDIGSSWKNVVAKVSEDGRYLNSFSHGTSAWTVRGHWKIHRILKPGEFKKGDIVKYPIVGGFGVGVVQIDYHPGDTVVKVGDKWFAGVEHVTTDEYNNLIKRMQEKTKEPNKEEPNKRTEEVVYARPVDTEEEIMITNESTQIERLLEMQNQGNRAKWYASAGLIGVVSLALTAYGIVSSNNARYLATHAKEAETKIELAHIGSYERDGVFDTSEVAVAVKEIGVED